jgi:hypothetical protein
VLPNVLGSTVASQLNFLFKKISLFDSLSLLDPINLYNQSLTLSLSSVAAGAVVAELVPA